MSELKRPTQTDSDRMGHAEKGVLILSLFGVLEGFGRRLKESWKARSRRPAGIRANRRSCCSGGGTTKDQVLRFLTDWRIPFGNNLAEKQGAAGLASS